MADRQMSQGKFKVCCIMLVSLLVGFPGGAVVKNLPAKAGDLRDLCSIPGSGRPPGEGNGNPFQDSCLKNPMNRRAWWATVQSVTKSQTDMTEQLSPLYL